MTAFKEIKIGDYFLRFWPSDNGWMCGITPQMMEALEQPEPVQDIEAHYKVVVEGVQKLFNDKRTQPAPVQEPVAWVNHGENKITRVTGWDGYGALYTTPPAQPAPVQEPVAIYCKAKRENNGVCPNHNLQCGWPECNKPSTPVKYVSSEQLSTMFQDLKGIDTSQSGYHWRVGYNAALRQAMDYSMPSYTTPQLKQEQGEPVALAEYDAGSLNDYGGGNVGWWWDYIRYELGRAHDHYQEQVADLYTTPPAQREWVGLTDEEIAKLDCYDHLKFARAIEAKLKEKNT